MAITFDNLSGIVCNGDIELVKFEFVNGLLNYVEKYNVEDKLFPFELRGCNETSIRHLLILFLTGRATSSNRQDIHRELIDTPIQYWNPERMIRYNKGISVNDSYWVKCRNLEEGCLSEFEYLNNFEVDK